MTDALRPYERAVLPGDVAGVISARATCRGCGAEIVWITMRSGKRMPADAWPVYGDWKTHLVVVRPADKKRGAAGEVFTKAPPTVVGRVPHWITCPNRDDFKH